MVPGERAFELHQLQILAVQLSDDARIPVVIEQRELLREIDFVHSSSIRSPRVSKGLVPWLALPYGRASDTTLSSWVVMNAANFIINLAGQHQPEHLPVAHERPEWMHESCGPVFFDEEVSRPCQAVARHKRQRKQPPPARRDEQNQQHHRRKSTGGVQQARGRLAVLAQVVWPEVGKRIEPALIHDESSAAILTETRCRF